MSDDQTGKTKSQGWEIGVRRTFPISTENAWTLLTTTDANTTSFTTGTLAKGAWHFRVSAFNAAGDSAFTSIVTTSL